MPTERANDLLTALLHRPSPRLQECELTYLASQAIDFERAARQHRAYADMLRRCGVDVLVRSDNLHLPDSVFVEDTAVVFDELAIVTSMGAASRQAETEAVAGALQAYRETARIAPPATIEGGDVLCIGRQIYVGRSTRTNAGGLAALTALVAPYGYQVRPVPVSGCLHLKTGCTALDDRTVLINPEWVDPEPFGACEQIVIPRDEPFGANALKIGETICLHAGMPKTRALIARRGYRTEVTDISEFLKAEAGLTCMSLVFNRCPHDVCRPARG